MKIASLRGILGRTMDALPAHADELRTLDAALGDGDLGITITAGATAVRRALDDLDPDATADQLVLTAAKAFMNANPSTFAALVGGGLLAASRTVTGKDDVISLDAAAILHACMDSIARRGKTQLGDKTVLDALHASIDALDAAPPDAGSRDATDILDRMIAATEQSVRDTAGWKSAKGRAAWMQERSVGLTDPGSMAYLFLLRELRDHWTN